MVLQSLLFIPMFLTFTGARLRHLNGGNDIQLFIRSHGGEIHPLEIPSDSTIGYLIATAFDAGYILKNSVLSFGGQRLSVDDNLADAGIGSESMLYEELGKTQFVVPTSSYNNTCYEICDGGERLKYLRAPWTFDGHALVLSPSRLREFKFRVLHPSPLELTIIDLGHSSEFFKAGDIVTISIVEGGIRITVNGESRVKMLGGDSGSAPEESGVHEEARQRQCVFVIRDATAGTEIEIIQ